MKQAKTRLTIKAEGYYCLSHNSWPELLHLKQDMASFFNKGVLLWGHGWPLGPNRFRVSFLRCTTVPRSVVKLVARKHVIDKVTCLVLAEAQPVSEWESKRTKWIERGKGWRREKWQNIKRGKARCTMRAKFVTAGIEDVGLMVTIITRFRRGSFSIGTFEQRVRGETWPKVILQLFSIFCAYFFFWWYWGDLRRTIVIEPICYVPPTIISILKICLGILLEQFVNGKERILPNWGLHGEPCV